MKHRSYGQYCGLARALELVGDRWALLVVRDLLIAPRRFSELEEGLPGLSSSVLASRLRELEAAAIVRREILPRPESGFRYALTDFGRDLDEVLVALGRWGARVLGPPHPGEVVTADSLVMALRTIFRPEKARGFRCSYELRVGDAVVHARVDDGALEVGPGPLPGADVVIEGGPSIRCLVAGECTASEAVAEGMVRLTGDEALLERFAEVFRIGPSPEPSARPLPAG